MFGLHDAGAIIGAVCAGPILLAKAGLLRGRRFTHGYGDHHKEFLAPFWNGAQFTDEMVTVDDRIVTGKAQAHVEFGIQMALSTAAIDSASEAARLRVFYTGS